LAADHDGELRERGHSHLLHHLSREPKVRQHRARQSCFHRGQDFYDPSTIKALSIGARASEVTDAKQRERAVKLLLERHPGLRKLDPPALDHSAVMRANPEITDMTPARDDDWGFGAVLKPLV
jgi:hypothetical protein